MAEQHYELLVGFYASGGIISEFSEEWENNISHSLRVQNKFKLLSGNERFKFFEIKLFGSYSKIPVPSILYEHASLKIFIHVPFDVLKSLSESRPDSVCVLSALISIEGGFKDSGIVTLEGAKLYHSQDPEDWEYHIGKNQETDSQ